MLLIAEGKRDGKTRASCIFASRTDFSGSLSRPEPPGLRKKVLEALDGLKKKPDAEPEQVLSIEKLIGEAYSIIDKAVKVGTLHRNTGAWRKSRLARRKKAVG